MLPARPIEAAVATDLLRVVVAHVLLHRKDYGIEVTAKAQARYPAGVMVRLGVMANGTIHAWLEPSRPGQRRGVVYIAGEDGATVAGPSPAEEA